MSITCFSPSDRIDILIEKKYGVTISPLTFKQKKEIESSTEIKEGRETPDFWHQMFLAVKYCVKDVKGFNTSDNKKLVLEFDSEGIMSDDSTELLLNSRVSNQLQITCKSFLAGVPSAIVNPITMEPLKGIEIVFETSKKKKLSRVQK